MKIFLTGGTGFIGRYVVKELKKKHDLAILTSQKNLKNGGFENIQIYHGNLSDKKGIENIITDFNPDSVIHLAWGGISENDYSIKKSIINFKHGLNLLESLIATNCKKMIFAGSCWEYGEKQGKLNEDDICQSFNPITAAKNSLRDFGKVISKEISSQFYWLRIFYVFGAGQEKGIVYNTIRSIKEESIPLIKNPFSKHDFIYVEDVAKAFVKIIEEDMEEGIYNIGSGYSISVQDVVTKVYNLFEKEYKKEAPKNIKFNNQWADISKMKKNGWEPKTSLEEGIKKMIENLK